MNISVQITSYSRLVIQSLILFYLFPRLKIVNLVNYQINALQKSGIPLGAGLLPGTKTLIYLKKLEPKWKTRNLKKKLYQRLWMLEGIMNELKNYHGLNRAHYRGLDNVGIQGYMAAIAINIKRIIYFWLWRDRLELFIF